MVNIKKVAHLIKFDGMYNTIYQDIEDKLLIKDPSVEQIEELIIKEEYYIWEYKELNRYGELSSVHAQKLDIKEEDSSEIKEYKETLNEETQKLRNLEMFEVDSKNSAYSIWIGSVGVMVIFMAHNLIALFSEYYTSHGSFVYAGYALVLYFTYWVYKKAKSNHENQHSKYKILLRDTREMVKKGLEKHFFTYDEFYKAI